VRVSYRGQVVKVHPRLEPGRRATDPADLPSEKTAYALRDIEHLRRLAAGHGEAIGIYASALLDNPLPWTKMRQVYRLLGLVRRYGEARVEDACRRALEAEAVDVGLIGRMLERAVEPQAPLPGMVVSARFARDDAHFAVQGRDCPHSGIDPPGDRGTDATTAAASSADVAEEVQ
jgi:hypothetical protein